MINDFTLDTQAELLHRVLNDLREQKVNYKYGLLQVTEFVNTNNGQVIEKTGNETVLILGGEEAICFQPYEDIDLFYYEM
jgi:hypothetical protein